MRGFLPYNGRNRPRPFTIGWLLWAILLSLPDCSRVSHGFEPCLSKTLALRGANLSKADLTDANLGDADLADVDLTDANLTGAIITNEQKAQAKQKLNH